MSDLERNLTPEQPEGCLSRRTLLCGVTVGGLALPVVAACGGQDSSSSTSSDSTSPASPDSGSPGDPGAGDSGAAGGVTVATGDVPVGGGIVLTADKLVVTQPTKGEYKAFTAVCTHQGCTVNKVAGGEIVCPCHGSHFSISDGSPVAGPASSPLGAKKVSVKGGQVSVT